MFNSPFASTRERKLLLALVGFGGLALVCGPYLDLYRFWPSFFVHAFYFLSLALGALVFLSIQHVSNAGWSAALRRIPEALMSYLPIGAVSILAIYFGRYTLYEWTHTLPAAHTEALRWKASFLSVPFFFSRMAFFLAVWMLFAFLLRRESLQQDRDGLLEHTGRSKALAAGFLAVFAVTFSMASFDWLMSLEPEFYSTIYALYCFSGLFVGGIAAITVCVILLRRRGWLAQTGPHHLHSLGKLVVAFSTFWAYIWLCQYILVYYANLPEETIYYIRRTATPAWSALFVLNLFLNWAIPFGLLLSRKAKCNERVLLTACVVVLLGHWLDLYLMVIPVFGGAPVFGWVDAALLAGFAALFALVFQNSLAKAPLLPEHDPYLEESLWMATTMPESDSGWSRDSKWALVLSTAAFGLTFAVWGLVGSLAPRCREMYQLSSVQTSLLIAIPVILGAVGRLPIGILADRFGGRLVLGMLLTFCLIPALGVSFTHSYAGLLGWAFVMGLAGTSFSAGVAFTSKWFAADQQGTALGIYGIGDLGQSVAMFGAPALILMTGDWRIPFWVFGVATSLFGLAFFGMARNAPVTAQTRSFTAYLGILRREPIAWVLSLLYFLTFGGFVALSLYLPTLLKDLFGLRPANAGFRMAGFVVVATLFRPAGGWLADRFGGGRVLLLVLSAVSLTALGLTSTRMVSFTLAALSTAALLGTGNGAVFKLVPEYFPRETGTVAGLVGAAGGLGGFFPPLVLGVIHQQTGSYAMGFVLLSLFALLCLAVNYWVFVRQNDVRREAAAMNY